MYPFNYKCVCQPFQNVDLTWSSPYDLLLTHITKAFIQCTESVSPESTKYNDTATASIVE